MLAAERPSQLSGKDGLEKGCSVSPDDYDKREGVVSDWRAYEIIEDGLAKIASDTQRIKKLISWL